MIDDWIFLFERDPRNDEEWAEFWRVLDLRGALAEALFGWLP